MRGRRWFPMFKAGGPGARTRLAWWAVGSSLAPGAWAVLGLWLGLTASAAELRRYNGKPLSEWAEQLQAGEVMARRQAADTLWGAGMAATQATAQIVAALEDKDALVRETAAQTLERIGPHAASAVPALAKRLQDAAPAVRSAAAQALAEMRAAAKAAIPALLKALEYPDHESRRQAAQALIWIAPDADAAEVIVPLSEIIRQVHKGDQASKYVKLWTFPDDQMLCHAAAALGRFGPRAAPAADALRAVVADAQVPWKSRMTCAWALGMIGPEAKDALPALRAARADAAAPLLRPVAGLALERIKTSPPDPGRRP